jgi:hypothetical protein
MHCFLRQDLLHLQNIFLFALFLIKATKPSSLRPSGLSASGTAERIECTWFACPRADCLQRFHPRQTYGGQAESAQAKRNSVLTFPNFFNRLNIAETVASAIQVTVLCPFRCSSCPVLLALKYNSSAISY